MKLQRSSFSRIGWFSLAMLFLLTGVVLTALIGYQATHQNNKNQENSVTQTSQAPTCTNDSSIKINQPDVSDKFNDSKIASFTPLKKIDKLACIDIKVGDGTVANADSTLSVNYVGALASDGTIFDSSYKSGQPASFPLTQVINGWTLGLQGMKAGGVRRLLIPAADGYGANPPTGSGIPPNADLVFDVSLISVN